MYLLVLHRGKYLPVVYNGEHAFWEFIIDIVAFCVTVSIIICFVVSICEIIKLHDEKTNAKLADAVASGNSQIKTKEY